MSIRPLKTTPRSLVVTALCLFVATAAAKPAPKRASPPPAPAKPAPAATPPPVATPVAPAKTSAQTDQPRSASEVVRHESKIEFDERLVQGQRAAGAIYLFQRGESEFHSMVQTPDSFNERTIRRVFPISASNYIIDDSRLSRGR